MGKSVDLGAPEHRSGFMNRFSMMKNAVKEYVSAGGHESKVKVARRFKQRTDTIEHWVGVLSEGGEPALLETAKRGYLATVWAKGRKSPTRKNKPGSMREPLEPWGKTGAAAKTVDAAVPTTSPLPTGPVDVEFGVADVDNSNVVRVGTNDTPKIVAAVNDRLAYSISDIVRELVQSGAYGSAESVMSDLIDHSRRGNITLMGNYVVSKAKA